MKDKFFTVLNKASCHEHFGVEVWLDPLLTLAPAGKVAGFMLWSLHFPWE